MKGVIHKRYLELYRIWVKVSFDAEVVKRQFNIHTDTSGFGGFAHRRTNDKGGNEVVIYLQMNEGSILLPDAAHECYHAADFIGEHAGLEYKYGSGNEHIAYIISYLMEFVLDCVDDENKLKGN